MQGPKTLRRPSNWQDFEMLCKKLWGEIWRCPEIKKNGRAGQAQHGVDIYGIPLGEMNYFGIQCKAKDEFVAKHVTGKEIIQEIEKAKLFQPPLKKFYFATTAVRDTVIEEFVRERNIENKTKGLFEVHIFFWEDIVELIDENKETHDWYLKSQNYKNTDRVLVSFRGGITELIINPQFVIKNVLYEKAEFSSSNTLFHPFLTRQNSHENISPINSFFSKTLVNLSYCSLNFLIINIGINPLEDFKLNFEFEGDLQDISPSNEEHMGLAFLRAHHYNTDVILHPETMTGKVIPDRAVLVSDESWESDTLFIKPLPVENNVTIKWKLISRTIKDEGVLKITVRPEFKEMFKTVYTEDVAKIGTNELVVEDLILEKEGD